MKIVHVSMADYNGAGLCAYRICKSQREMGIDSQMVVLHKHHKDDFVHQSGSKRYFYYSALRKIKLLLSIHDEVNSVRKLGALHKAVYTLPVSPIKQRHLKILLEADLIHIHWVGGYLDYPSFFEAFKNKPIVFTLHDENALFGIANIEQQMLPNNPMEQKYRKLKEETLRQVEQVGFVFLSKKSYNLYGNYKMVRDRQKTIIYNSVDYTLFQPKDKKEARKRLGIPQNAKIFAFCACNINEPRKGLDIFSETLLRINPEYHIIAIGKNRSHPLKKWKNVIELGPTSNAEEMSWRLSAADYSCLPSFKENFAQAPLEALACGIPVITFPCSGSEELITSFNGICCNDFTSAALEGGIRQAMNTPYDARAIYEDARKRFSPKKICQDYLNFYKDIMKQK